LSLSLNTDGDFLFSSSLKIMTDREEDTSVPEEHKPSHNCTVNKNRPRGLVTLVTFGIVAAVIVAVWSTGASVSVEPPVSVVRAKL
jgi:hypothetical protein